MKKSVLLAVLVASVIAIACSNDSDSGEAPTPVADMTVNDMSAADMAVSEADMGTEQNMDQGAAPVGVNQQTLLASLSDDVFAPSFASFAVAAEALAVALTSYAENQTEESIENAQNAWRDAMSAWQLVEVMQVGPLAKSGTRAGGEDGRDRVYSWPVSNACRVDQEIVSGNFAGPDWVAGALLNVQGLDTLEYLLFYEGEDNSCPGAVRINRDGEWAALAADPAALSQQKADYALVLGTHLVVEANRARDAWAEGADFAQSFRAGTTPFDGHADALDEVFSGLFYVDKLVKDRKLGRILGITEDCEADACPEDVESPYAKASTQNLIQNLRGFRLALEGGPLDNGETGIGFFDLLAEEGADSLAQRILENTDAAIAVLEEIGTDIGSAMAQDRAAVEAAHAAVKAITDDLKGEFVTILSLEIPAEGAGDND